MQVTELCSGPGAPPMAFVYFEKGVVHAVGKYSCYFNIYFNYAVPLYTRLSIRSFIDYFYSNNYNSISFQAMLYYAGRAITSVIVKLLHIVLGSQRWLNVYVLSHSLWVLHSRTQVASSQHYEQFNNQRTGCSPT